MTKKEIYVASVSFGKDSLAMLLRLLDEKKPLDYVVFFDTEMEFEAIYNNIDKVKPLLDEASVKLIILKPDNNWLYDMLIRPVKYRDGSGVHYGYEWCGRNCRWRTSDKTNKITEFYEKLKSEYLDCQIHQYIGIASDELQRVKDDSKYKKIYPLVDWKMTEKDCLAYCYTKGFHWLEDNGKGELIELYSILSRVSCWCCAAKSLPELKAMYINLYDSYWQRIKGLQSRIDRPFRSDGSTIYDLEHRFKLEESQLKLNLIV